jgi:hypothetical protein
MKTSSCKYTAITLTLLIFLPSCKLGDWVKEKFERTPEPTITHITQEKISTESSSNNLTLPDDLAHLTVVTIEGKAALTGKEFDKYMQLIAQAHPEIAQFLPLMPQDQQLEMLTKIADSALADQLIIREVRREGLDQTSEYKEQSQQAHEMLDRQLAQLVYQNKLAKSLTISNEEAQKYYETNSNNPAFKRPPFVVHMGGVKAEGIAVNSAKEAQDLLEQAKKGTDFTQLAQKAKSAATSFGIVNTQSSTVDAQIRKKAHDVKSFPTFEVIKGTDNKHWVVKFIEKVDMALAPFEQVADKVKELMMQQKFQDALTKEIERLKSSYKAQVNKDFIKTYLERTIATKNKINGMDLMQEEVSEETLMVNNKK